MKIMPIKDFYESIKNIVAIEAFKNLQFPAEFDFNNFWLKPSKHLIPLESPEEMLLARQLALYVNPDDSFDKDCKGEWQRFWLRCCVRDESNYFFAVFKELGINREDDVQNIMNGQYLWDIVKSQEGIDFYKRAVVDWFLRRYNRRDAKSILKTIKDLKCIDKIRFWYPRLIVAIIIGFLPLITQKDMWLMPLNLSEIFVVFLGVLLFGLSYGYLVYECNKIINDITEARNRASSVCLPGFLISLLFSIFICLLIGPAILIDNTKNIIETNCSIIRLLKLGNLFWQDIIFFAFSALFIGIFIQLLWEEKTVTEPL